MPIAPIFEEVFKKLYGKPCWGVKQGVGSCLTFEFGSPHLEITEPKSVGMNFSPKVREILARRRIYVHGQWHLWIYFCDWAISSKGRRIASSNSRDDTIKKGTSVLDGQKLVRFSVIPRGNRSVFEFDLGGTLVTRPCNRRGEQWLLFCPARKVLTMRADKCYKYHSSKSRTHGPWKPVVPTRG
jgi:hypothetical protein